MGMTVTEKILAAHADEDRVVPGEMIQARVDLALANDITGPLAIERFRRMGVERVMDPDRLVFVADHFTPNKDVDAARHCAQIRAFALEQGITHHYELGDGGVEHALLPERGMIVPGDLVVGADSHTCTYGALGAFASGVGSTDLAAVMATGEIWLKVPPTVKIVFRGRLREWVEGKDLILFLIGRIGVEGARYCALEFSGEVVDRLDMAGRMTIANMVVEAGAKNGIFPVDPKVLEYLHGRTDRKAVVYESDRGASYLDEKTFDVSRLEPQVALPFSPDNVMPVREAGDVAIDQVVIGSCTNGRISDLRTAAAVLKGKKRHDYLRLLIFPATERVYSQALSEGLFEIFIQAGAVISPPTCGPCLGGHMGVLADGEKAIATTNRNFTGRMGHPGSEVYLSNPAVAAASAVKGRIASPEELDI